ncbi:glycosyltransferase family 25 protein [Nitrosomonas sp. Nm166]|uniref:glycosyltransferase family 25 protein n=1 Tax=Nitrosomonas sp. Nm166 TaxID=1881054 RepID=UPI0008ECF2F6|nr:glycosyltransferase family 25 protein [Nitrosomonas sp. Nm166]SFF18205.1 Glycosyltransferase family 25 (LPS biosynthesis protein) [Nitrosomonas sp. Nm166]
MRNLYRKYIQSHRGATVGPWRWVFDTKTVLQTASSAGSLALDRLFFTAKRNDTKLLYAQTDSVDFDIVCINLLRRPDKRQFIEKQFGTADFNLKIFSAIDGLTIDTNQLIDDGRLSPGHHCPATGMPLTPAQIGAYLSHYELWRAALASPNKISLILEDDALMTCNKATLEEFARNIPEDADLFFINRRKNKTKHISLHASKFVSHFWGLTAYFLTKQGAEKLITLSLPIYKSADEAISELNENGMINCYCSRKELVVECSNPRDARNFRFTSDIISRT